MVTQLTGQGLPAPQYLSKASRGQQIQPRVPIIRQVTRQVRGEAGEAAHRLGSGPVGISRVGHNLAIARQVHTVMRILRSS